MSIGVVIVTYNRLGKLKTALEKFEEQTLAPSYLVVVDNASTDGTGEFLDAWLEGKGRFDRHLVRLPSNEGGSGGFYAGFKHAMERGAEWVYVSDDDAFPEPDALANAEEYLASAESDVVAICSSVYNQGSIDRWHRYRLVKGWTGTFRVVGFEEYEKPEFDVDAASYVGLIVRRASLSEVGITRRDYFIHQDDLEHTLRLGRAGRVVCVPVVKVNHDVLPGERHVCSWKDYYTTRNILDVYRRHFPYATYLFQYGRHFARNLIRAGRSRCPEVMAVYFDACKDFKAGRFGLSDKYMPGWYVR